MQYKEIGFGMNIYYSIIFTCIVLSDEKFVVTSKSHLNDSDGVTSVVFYFYSLCAIVVCKANYDRKVVHQNRGEWDISYFHFGLHMKPYDRSCDNFPEIHHDYLTEQLGCDSTRMTCSCFNVTFIKADEYV